MSFICRLSVIVWIIYEFTVRYSEPKSSHYQLVTTRQDLQIKECYLYRVSQHLYLRSNIECARICTKLIQCFNYEYNINSKMCLVCMLSDGEDTYPGLSSYSQEIQGTGRIFEKDTLVPTDCADLYENYEIRTSGVYAVYHQDRTVYVDCDMNTSGGGWTVFQRREDGSVPFNRTWQEYKQGFGYPEAEFWLGNELLSQMTSSPREYLLRIELTSFNDDTRYAEYDHFHISDETDKYRLSIGRYSGTAGDGGEGLSSQNNWQFTTIDSDNDNKAGNCAELFGGGGGFWYKDCDYVNTNGAYRHSPVTDEQGIEWRPWLGTTTLKGTEMKFRPMDFPKIPNN